MKKDVRYLSISSEDSQEILSIDVSLFLKQKRTIYKLANDPKLSTKQQNHLIGVLNMLDGIHDVLIPIK